MPEKKLIVGTFDSPAILRGLCLAHGKIPTMQEFKDIGFDPCIRKIWRIVHYSVTRLKNLAGEDTRQMQVHRVTKSNATLYNINYFNGGKRGRPPTFLTSLNIKYLGL